MANRLRQSQSTTDKNAAILRELLKRAENRVCADCHVATHPRWASWSLGVFICIRCSGIHRGMGTHISRVKSADLDAWTDEQTEMMMKWGNRRANKYWEASLPPSHIPSDSKMENFIRTKYSSKRWVLSPVPPQDPSILDDIDSASDTQEDSLPLSIVKQKLSSPPQPSRQPASQSRSQAPTTPNLLGNDTPPPSRSVNSEISNLRSLTPSPKSSRARNDRISNQSLLGLDFDSPVRTRSAPIVEPATTVTTTTTSMSSFTTSGAGASVARPASRNDLKNSILRLYAPKPVTPQTNTPVLQSAASAPASASAPVVTSSNALGDLNSAFGGLSFSSAGSSAATAKSPTTGFTSPLTSPPLSTSAFAPTSPPTTTTTTSTMGSNAFGGTGHIAGKLSFGQTSNAPIPPATAPVQPSSFTIPIKRTSPAVTSPPITAQPARASPPAPQTSKYNPSTTNANTNLLADMSHSKWGSTFNLSNSKANNITTGGTPSSTGPSAQTKSGSSGIQLLSSLTPTTSSGVGMGVSGLTSSGPTTGRNFSSFDDPWASTSNSTGAAGAANASSSSSAMGGLAGFTSDPWSSSTTAPSTTTTTTMSTTSTSNDIPPFSTPTTTNAFSAFSSAPATNTSSSSFAPTSSNSGAFTAPTSSAFDSWGSTTTAANDKGWSTTSANDKSWGNMTSASASTTTTNGKRDSKESGFDDFGLFETADVWK